MENIFKDAKFGDKFLTRDGRIAIYNSSYIPHDWTNIKALDAEHRLIIEGEGAELVYLDKNNGMIETPIRDNVDYRKDVDIVAKYTIDEEKLDEIADSETYERSEEFNNYLDDILSLLDVEKQLKLIFKKCLIWAFKAGYLKAKQD